MTEYDLILQHVEAERDYWKQVAGTQKEVIKQLSGEKLAVVYIHPYDLHELISVESRTGTVASVTSSLVHTDFRIGDVTYRRSHLIPAKTTVIS